MRILEAAYLSPGKEWDLNPSPGLGGSGIRSVWGGLGFDGFSDCSVSGIDQFLHLRKFVVLR